MKTHSHTHRSMAKGFTLLEILAATVVATILLTVSLQILGGSSEAVKEADKKRNAHTHLRTALDRFAADFSTAMLSGGNTAIWREGQAGSELTFLSRSRPALPTSSGTSAAPRGAAIGYALLDHQETSSGTSYPELKRGDAPVTFESDLADVFKKIPDSGDALWNEWEPLGTGIVRFHISFLLDDGTITQTPPAYSMTSPQTGNEVSFLNDLQLPAGAVAIAFSERNIPRATANGRYVKALIVAAAAVDRDVLNQALRANKLSELGDLGEPGPGETPLEAWEKNLTRIQFKPLLQNIRFQQRTIPVS
jgi:prepilin-type N-terminal cleavage/methylation domain-containing protein